MDMVPGDRYEGQKHVKDVRGQVKRGTKFQEAGYDCDGCCSPSSKPRAWHMVEAQHIFEKRKRDWWGTSAAQEIPSCWRRGGQVYQQIF